MFRKAKESSNRLTRLLESEPNVPLKTVLVNPDLSVSLRNESQLLMNYFLPESGDRKVLRELIDWALTNKRNENKDDFIYNRNAANVLTCVSKKFHNALYKDGTLLKELKSFINNSHYNESPSLSGQFSAIFLQHTRQTNFIFFKENPDFYLKILDHIHLLSYQRILIDTLSETDVINNLKPEKITVDLSNRALETDLKNEEISHGIFTTIDTIIKESSDEVIGHFSGNEEFLSNIVAAALKLKNQYVIIDAFRTLELLFKYVDDKLKDRITGLHKIDFSTLIKKNQMIKVILYYPIFWKQGIAQITDYFLQDLDKKTGLIPNSKLCRSYVNVFKQMSYVERIQYVKELHLVNRLYGLSNKVQYNGLIYLLIKALSRPPKKEEENYLLNPDEKHPFNSDNWEFLVMKYAEYYDQIKVKKYKQVGFEKKKSSY